MYVGMQYYHRSNVSPGHDLIFPSHHNELNIFEVSDTLVCMHLLFTEDFLNYSCFEEIDEISRETTSAW